MSYSITDLKIELLALGIKVPDNVETRLGGAGPADGVTLFIGDKTVCAPALAPYVSKSPFELIENLDGCLEIQKRGKTICTGVTVAPEPRFYRETTLDGVSLKKVALRHGRDGVGSTVVQSCAYGKFSCVFCAISESLKSARTVRIKDSRDLATVAKLARGEGFMHFVLTTGTTNTADRGIELLLECAARIKSASGMKVHAQFEPPFNPDIIEKLSGIVDCVAINIESFDLTTRRLATPGKSLTSLGDFTRTWKRAVEVFGFGQVASFIIIGLGESHYSILEACRTLSSLGVYPFLLPLRPIKGTPIENFTPPQAWEMSQVFEKAAEIVRSAGLKASEYAAGCVRCTACSAFPDITG